MEMATYLVTAVLMAGQSVRQVARDHGVSKTWLYELLARYEAEGEAGPARWRKVTMPSHRPCRGTPRETGAPAAGDRLRQALQSSRASYLAQGSRRTRLRGRRMVRPRGTDCRLRSPDLSAPKSPPCP